MFSAGGFLIDWIVGVQPTGSGTTGVGQASGVLVGWTVGGLLVGWTIGVQLAGSAIVGVGQAGGVLVGWTAGGLLVGLAIEVQRTGSTVVGVGQVGVGVAWRVVVWVKSSLCTTCGTEEEVPWLGGTVEWRGEEAPWTGRGGYVGLEPLHR